jgi:hypothetical protein
MKTFFFSFGADVGVVITDADSESDALSKLTRLRLNPGGEAAVFELPPGEDHPELTELGKDRFISPSELIQKGYLSQPPDHPALDIFATIICPDCNPPPNATL